MSHVIDVKLKTTDGKDLKIDNLETVKITARALGGIFHEGQTKYKSYGSRQLDCEHAISFEDCKWEVGIVRKPDGSLVPMFDPYPSDKLGERMGGREATKFVEAYSGVHQQLQNAAKLAAISRRNRRAVSQTVTESGTIRVQIRIP